MNGLHIIGNFHHCKGPLNDYQTLFEQAQHWCRAEGLTIVGSPLHAFDPHACTFSILLAESHFCIHTWPETLSCAFDIYVCNYQNDNRQKAQNIALLLQDYLDPEMFKIQELDRLSICPHPFYENTKNSIASREFQKVLEITQEPWSPLAL